MFKQNKKRNQEESQLKFALLVAIQFYIIDVIELETLEDWYVPKLESFVNDPQTCDIISQLELELAELQIGLITEDDLKNNLRNILTK